MQAESPACWRSQRTGASYVDVKVHLSPNPWPLTPNPSPSWAGPIPTTSSSRFGWLLTHIWTVNVALESQGAGTCLSEAFMWDPSARNWSYIHCEGKKCLTPCCTVISMAQRDSPIPDGSQCGSNSLNTAAPNQRHVFLIEYIPTFIKIMMCYIKNSVLRRLVSAVIT